MSNEQFLLPIIEVMNDTPYSSIMVESEATSGDLLHAFFWGSWQALAERRRESIFITIREVSPLTVGMLIALFYSVVGLNPSLISISGHRQPRVEARKKIASNVILVQRQVSEFLSKRDQQPFIATEIAGEIETAGAVEEVFKTCELLSWNPNRTLKKLSPELPFAAQYSFN
jgi:glucose-6-phosphate isomerase